MKYYKLINSLKKIHPVLLILLTVIFNILISVLMFWVAKHLFHKRLNAGAFKFPTKTAEFFFVVFLAPILETMIFQAFVIEMLKQKIAMKYCCLISAVLFALTHTYNVFYFLLAVAAGLSFAILYYIGSLNKKGFLLVVTAHALYNLTVWVLQFV
jgi:uncharacterized protein